MKLFNVLCLTLIAAFVFSFTGGASADEKDEKPAMHHHKHTMDKMGEYKEVTYEGNKKITTTYHAIGTRKVGLVGGRPYDVARNHRLADGGDYYTQDGVKYFRDTKKLNVTYQGQLNGDSR